MVFTQPRKEVRIQYHVSEAEPTTLNHRQVSRLLRQLGVPERRKHYPPPA